MLSVHLHPAHPRPWMPRGRSHGPRTVARQDGGFHRQCGLRLPQVGREMREYIVSWTKRAFRTPHFSFCINFTTVRILLVHANAIDRKREREARQSAAGRDAMGLFCVGFYGAVMVIRGASHLVTVPAGDRGCGRWGEMGKANQCSVSRDGGRDSHT